MSSLKWHDSVNILAAIEQQTSHSKSWHITMPCFKQAYWSTTVTIPKGYSHHTGRKSRGKTVSLLYSSPSGFKQSSLLTDIKGKRLQWHGSYLSASWGAERNMAEGGDHSWRQTEETEGHFLWPEHLRPFSQWTQQSGLGFSTSLWSFTACVWNQILSLAPCMVLNKLCDLSNLVSLSEKWRKSSQLIFMACLFYGSHCSGSLRY